MEIALFYVLAALTIVSALLVVMLPNPVFSTLSLIVTLVSVAGLFGLLGAPFLAVVQVIVYAGAIVVLVLFVVMLLNIKQESTESILKFHSLAAIVGAVIFFSAIGPLISAVWSVKPVLLKPQVGSVEAIGNLLFDKYVFPFEAASILILAALVGAVMLATTRKSGREELKK